jgi:hypothetical protein
VKWRVTWFDENRQRQERICHYSTEATRLAAKLYEDDAHNIVLETLMEHKDKHGDPDAGKARWGGGETK